MRDPALILASSSPYRLDLLRRAGFNCESRPPGTAESMLEGEPPVERALRLGKEKARAVAAQLDQDASWLVIGSDQVCHLEGRIFNKPGDRDTAQRHLHQFSGREVTFSTSLAVISSRGRELSDVEDYRVRFRELDDRLINHYLTIDEPWDCAGAIKVERAGTLLLAETHGRDVSALYGLPLMLFMDFLERLDYSLNDFR